MKQHLILVIDDSKTALGAVRHILSGEHRLLLASSGEEALGLLHAEAPDLILLDLFMPGMDGPETLTHIRAVPGCEKLPVIFFTAAQSTETEAECLALGARDFIVKPFAPEVLRSRIANMLELEDYRKDLQGRLDEKTREVEDLALQTILAIARAIDAKDEYTQGHSQRVATYSCALAEYMGWSEADCDNIYHIALLHDVGKIGVPDSVLKKSGPLTDEEFAQMRRHPDIGADILKTIRSLKGIETGTRFHHERYDGKGYPNGLKGDEIPLIARIICVADTFDAMTSTRCYRKRLDMDVARAELRRCAGTQFDPAIVEEFLAMLDEGLISAARTE